MIKIRNFKEIPYEELEVLNLEAKADVQNPDKKDEDNHSIHQISDVFLQHPQSGNGFWFSDQKIHRKQS